MWILTSKKILLKTTAYYKCWKVPQTGWLYRLEYLIFFSPFLKTVQAHRKFLNSVGRLAFMKVLHSLKYMNYNRKDVVCSWLALHALCLLCIVMHSTQNTVVSFLAFTKVWPKGANTKDLKTFIWMTWMHLNLKLLLATSLKGTNLGSLSKSWHLT